MDLTTAQPKDHAAGFAPRPTESLAHQLLAALAQHRLASTHQLRLLLRPDRSRQSVSQRLNHLLGEHLVDFDVLPQSHRTRIWHLTSKGARLTRDWPALRGRPPYPITSATAASLKTPHTLTVLRAHLAFVADARRRGDEHGHLDWTPEVSHAIGDQDRLIADAVMHYTLTESEQRRKLWAFVEIDRATMSSERLAAKLIEYARLWTYEPQPAGRRRQTGQPGWLRWSPAWPARYRWERPSWTTWNTTAPPATSGCLWQATSPGRGPSCDTTRPSCPMSQPCNYTRNP
jgi:hypothetical protein